MSTVDPSTVDRAGWAERLEVARWEFRRFVKPKQLLISLLLTTVAGAVGYGVARLAQRGGPAEATVAVIGGEALALAGTDSASGLTFVPAAPGSRDSLRALVAARELDGLLVLDGPDAATLLVSRERPWREALAQQLTLRRQAARLRSSALSADDLAALLAPVALTVATTDERGGGRGARLVALIAAGVVVYGVFTSMAYMFVSVTGEKQQRVTEQVISAIPPQAWIDGKILGLAGVAIVGVATIAVGVGLFVLGRAIATGGLAWPSASAPPGMLLLTAAFALLGFLFWLAFLGAIAATVDDPNTSTRGPLIFVPVLCTALAFAILRNPDSAFAQVIGLLPLTASAAMPVRLALTDVPAWEVALSLVLLAAGALFLRTIAGRIFAVGMLMYGKEPGWREIRRWAREG